MNRVVLNGVLVLSLTGGLGCGNREDQSIARAQAEAEAARLRIEAAKEEAAATQAEIERLEAEKRAEEEQRIREAEEKAEQAQADQGIRRRIGQRALSVVQRNGGNILNKAYPMAFGKLRFTRAELMGVGDSGSGYVATVRLNYKNLLNRNHYLAVAFEFDSRGGYRGNRVVDYSDSIAPGEITVGRMMKMTGY